MNDFELRLESDLRRLLNPMVAAQAPSRRPDCHRTDEAKPRQPAPLLTLFAIAAEAASS
jgi:hypothetical protein